MRPLVSVLMSCYNGEKFINSSVNSLLRQTYKNWELIFWDNCSTDNSSEIIRSFKDKRIKYFKSKSHTEIGIAKSNALKQAQGTYFAFLDVDDLWLKKKIEKQLNVFVKNGDDYSAVYTKYFLLDDKSKTKRNLSKINHKDYPSGYIFDSVLKSYSIGKPIVNNLTTLFKKSDILNLNLNIDENLHILADFDFIERLSEKKKILYLDYFSSIYRVHNKSETFNSKQKQIQEMEIWINKNSIRLKNNKYYKKFEDNNQYERLKLYSYEKKNIFKVLKSLKLIKTFNRKLKLLIILFSPKLLLKIFKIL
tara:strand:+ start:8552 stop:9472 length:921 start_codon:yes stop_codon:yes gene_type:complete